jgi:hypothetical protein
MNLYTPIICEETGFYGGNFHCRTLSREYAFRLLEIRIRNGGVIRRSYGAANESL